jgi:hypothetical protein
MHMTRDQVTEERRAHIVAALALGKCRACDLAGGERFCGSTGEALRVLEADGVVRRLDIDANGRRWWTLA